MVVSARAWKSSQVNDPTLVETLRGDLVESAHRGAFVVVDADGATIARGGDVERPVFPRSAVKLIQALPLVESGAADTLGFGNRELAMACSSHSSEPRHVEAARAMLQAAGLGEDALECGAHWPLFTKAPLIDLARSGEDPTPLHNNCSGKHAGFLCTCAHERIEPDGYTSPDHAAMQRARDALQDVTGEPHSDERMGIDGCNIPTWAVPLVSLARAFARIGTGVGLGRERSKAARRLLAAAMAEPFYTAGTRRFDTRVMEVAPNALYAKVGAEGVYCAAVPGEGVGIALKMEAGGVPAAEVALAAILCRVLEGAHAEAVGAMAHRTLRNWNGVEVGAMRPTAALNWAR